MTTLKNTLVNLYWPFYQIWTKVICLDHSYEPFLPRDPIEKIMFSLTTASDGARELGTYDKSPRFITVRNQIHSTEHLLATLMTIVRHTVSNRHSWEIKLSVDAYNKKRFYRKHASLYDFSSDESGEYIDLFSLLNSIHTALHQIRSGLRKYSSDQKYEIISNMDVVFDDINLLIKGLKEEGLI